MAEMERASNVKARAGPVILIVRDLDRVVAFYRDAIGLHVRRAERSTVVLGSEDDDLLILEGQPDAPAPPARSTGLYHVAFLVPSHADLARQLLHLSRAHVPLQGLSDHAVSEAIYLADPEANGIEIYADRPRDAWPYDANGVLQMTTDPLDVDRLLATPGANELFSGISRGTIIGHVHLRVADLAAAETFYREQLGMNVTTRYGNAASFLSYDGYHHHLGLNTWGSRHAPPPPSGSSGLKALQLSPPKEIAAGELRDPSGNVVVVQRD